LTDQWTLDAQATFLNTRPGDLAFAAFDALDRIGLGLQYHFDLSR